MSLRLVETQASEPLRELLSEQGPARMRDELVAEAHGTRQLRIPMVFAMGAAAVLAMSLFASAYALLQISKLQQKVEELEQHHLRQLTQENNPWTYAKGSNAVRLKEGVGLHVQGDLVVDSGNILLEGECTQDRQGKGNLIIGHENTYTSAQNSIIVGQGSTITGCGSIAGGKAHTIAADFAAIVGGERNKASGDFAAVVGGYDNTAEQRAGVFGGHKNIASGDHSVVAGGHNNTANNTKNVETQKDSASVFGGHDNIASGWRAAILGGMQNLATTNEATVVGGYANSALWKGSSVFGGARNVVEGDDAWFAVVVGGDTNKASGFGSLTLGGADNEVTKTYKVVVGAQQN